MCKWGTNSDVRLAYPMPISGRTVVAIDACVAPLVQVLNDYGIKTVGSCCGHGRGDGSVLIEQHGVVVEVIIPNAVMRVSRHD